MLMPCSLPLATLLWREAASKLRTRWEGAEREWRRLTAPAPAHSSCSALPPSPAARRSSSPRPDHCPSSHPVSACHKIPRASSRHSEWHCLADQPVRRLEQSRVISCNLVRCLTSLRTSRTRTSSRRSEAARGAVPRRGGGERCRGGEPSSRPCRSFSCTAGRCPVCGLAILHVRPLSGPCSSAQIRLSNRARFFFFLTRDRRGNRGTGGLSRQRR